MSHKRKMGDRRESFGIVPVIEVDGEINFILQLSASASMGHKARPWQKVDPFRGR